MRYDPALAGCNELWLALWKIRDDCKISGLGLRRLGALEHMEPSVATAANGINLAHPPMYRALGYRTFELVQHYAVNPLHPRRLVTHEGTTPLPRLNAGLATGTELAEANILSAAFTPLAVPYKTLRYFLQRFLQHPFYRYRVFHLAHDSHHALIATRVAIHGADRALRIADFSGDTAVLAESGTQIGAILHDEDAEYVDFWEYGIPSAALLKAGFGVVDPGGKIIVPNYYEPFVATNSRILCAIKSRGSTSRPIFRADGDQDRPNSMHAP
jgi:hypothetical protein